MMSTIIMEHSGSFHLRSHFRPQPLPCTTEGRNCLSLQAYHVPCYYSGIPGDLTDIRKANSMTQKTKPLSYKTMLRILDSTCCCSYDILPSKPTEPYLSWQQSGNPPVTLIKASYWDTNFLQISSSFHQNQLCLKC